MGCTWHIGQRCICYAIRAERPRDYSALYPNGRCAICCTPSYAETAWMHAAKHLAEGTAVVQMEKVDGQWRNRVLPTAGVPVVDESGFSVFESDGDVWDRNDTNAVALRDAYARARALNHQTRQRVAAAKAKA